MAVAERLEIQGLMEKAQKSLPGNENSFAFFPRIDGFSMIFPRIDGRVPGISVKDKFHKGPDSDCFDLGW